MNLSVPFLLVRAREPASANITCEWLLASVRPDMCGKVVTPGKGTHTNPALEGFLTGMNPDVPGELI